MRSAQGRLRDGSDLSLDQPLDWRRADFALPSHPAAVAADAALRERWDRLVLDWLRRGEPASARELSDLSLGLAAGQRELAPRAFWKIGAAYLEMLAGRGEPPAPAAKRAVAGLQRQCAALVRGESGVAQELAQTLLAQCREALPHGDGTPPLWAALRVLFEAVPARISDDWLNEADVDSQQLEAALTAWAVTPQLPLPPNAVPWAWALSVRADDAGLGVLADFASQLAMGLQGALGGVSADQAQMLAAAAEHLRQLLHQHAAGFEKSPQPALLQGLHEMALAAGRNAGEDTP